MITLSMIGFIVSHFLRMLLVVWVTFYTRWWSIRLQKQFIVLFIELFIEMWYNLQFNNLSAATTFLIQFLWSPSGALCLRCCASFFTAHKGTMGRTGRSSCTGFQKLDTINALCTRFSCLLPSSPWHQPPVSNARCREHLIKRTCM